MSDPLRVFEELRVKHKRRDIVHHPHTARELSPSEFLRAHEVGPEGFSMGKIPLSGSEGAIVLGIVANVRVRCELDRAAGRFITSDLAAVKM